MQSESKRTAVIYTCTVDGSHRTLTPELRALSASVAVAVCSCGEEMNFAVVVELDDDDRDTLEAAGQILRDDYSPCEPGCECILHTFLPLVARLVMEEAR